MYAGRKKEWDGLLPSLQFGYFLRLQAPCLRAVPIFPSDMPLGSEHGKKEGWCLPWSAAELHVEEISWGAFVGSKPNPSSFIHPSRLEFVLTVPEMQNNFNLCFLGIASLRLVYFFAGNFCWRLPYQWHKTVNKIQCSQNQQCCALTNPQNLGRSTKRKYAFCDSSRFLYSKVKAKAFRSVSSDQPFNCLHLHPDILNR